MAIHDVIHCIIKSQSDVIPLTYKVVGWYTMLCIWRFGNDISSLAIYWLECVNRGINRGVKFLLSDGVDKETIFRVCVLRYSCPNWPLSQIPLCTCPTSHNVPFITDMCTFLFWMCTVGYNAVSLWDLWDYTYLGPRAIYDIRPKFTLNSNIAKFRLPITHASVDRSLWHITAVLCAKFQTDWTIETDVTDERDFARFEFKMRFGRISYIAQYLWVYRTIGQFCLKSFKITLLTLGQSGA